MTADETHEFIQIVRVRLFENNYAIIRKFEGRSSFSTYLTTVIVPVPPVARRAVGEMAAVRLGAG